MLDNEIKKLLNELNANVSIEAPEGNKKPDEAAEAYAHDFLPEEQNKEQNKEKSKPIQRPEQQSHKEKAPVSHASGSKVLLAIACAALAPAGYMVWQTQTPVDEASSYIAYNNAEDDVDPQDAQQQDVEQQDVQQQLPQRLLQQEREATAASWAKEIVDIDVEDGRNVHVLWDMLRRRREDLEGVTRELTELLTNNAKFRQDFYAQTASVLLSRYQAIDARYSVELANQINAMYAQIKEAQNPDLTRAYAEMLGELGAESYSTHQIQIAKQLLQHEAMCQKALSNIAASSSLLELDYNLRLANQVVQVIETNGLLQTFHEGQEYQNMMAEKCKETLDKLLVADNSEALEQDLRALVEGILSDIGANQDEIQKYTDRFDALTKPEEVEPTSMHANC